ncbi:CCAATbinding transcription factor (CBF-B/NF-YA) subunit B domain containing protein [Acanthamoeba castellanii str. Neff]|uniref:Nuclear transcription factor Y subunit n=1 Tax=Acanthamoeba castellanii (strain ATCC 30010 / Neff) TaxID=1257118 RepID=L8H548_ACACF|nr:CCAATbinding transcription factor (CBF-B/NF-YA) subunit B domain containing protein [Acanthamoeba castellanii str. Neff]ELR19571.1 CCAATbinding transcription factor (CBF-B/NF-YA) subunit B domain containing protein [Acanthamoeba castellanii str. Neff]
MSRAAAVAAAAAVMQQQGYSSAEALQYAYQTASDGGSVIQYPFGMGLGSLQLAQMGSLLQAGQQYALLSGAEDAVYVNQKQFHRILKRRQARMKLEAKFKIMPRKEWLHDSRHKHAKNRQRGPGGRFLSKAERDKLGMDDDYDGEGYGDEGGSSSPPNPTSPAPSNFVG